MNTTEHRIAILRALASNAAAMPGERAAALLALEIHAAKLRATSGPSPHSGPGHGDTPDPFKFTTNRAQSSGAGLQDTVLSFENNTWTLSVFSRGIRYTWPGMADYYVDIETMSYRTGYGSMYAQYRPVGQRISVSAWLEVGEKFRSRNDPTELQNLVNVGYLSVLIGRRSSVALLPRALCRQISYRGDDSGSRMTVEIDLESDDITSWNSPEEAASYAPRGPHALSPAPIPLLERFS